MRPRRTGLLVRASSAVLAIGLGLGLMTAASCAPPERDGTVETKAVQLAAATTAPARGDLDVLFMIDDSSGMASTQAKLAAQIPSFINALESFPSGLPNIHIAVVSSDLGAASDSMSLTQCSSLGDQGRFRVSPSCVSSTLEGDAAYLSDVDGVANYTGNLADVLSCIMPLGETGCIFDQQLGSIARALGIDGSPAPAGNAGFLRSSADLAIIILSNVDDCSARPRVDLYSLNGGPDNTGNVLGPMARYRCNEFGHLCLDPSGDPSQLIPPPEAPPVDAQGAPSAPTLTLTDCESLDTGGLLTSVSALVSSIKALKADPDNQIFVGAMVAPPMPYTVDWVPPVGGENLREGELWPRVEDSCGSSDGSSGQPAVRISQLVQAFGHHGVSTSICSPSYAGLLSGLAAMIGDHLQAAPGGGGGSGAGAGGSGGALATDAGSGVTGDGGSGANAGSGGSGVSGKKTFTGLMNGGCAVGPSGPGAWSLTLLVAFLIVGAAPRHARRHGRRKPTERGEGPVTNG